MTYSCDALGMLLQGCQQTPEIVGGIGAEQQLAVSVGENGPDLTEMRMRGAAANDLEINADALAVPDAAMFEGGQVNFSAETDMRAEKLYPTALEVQKDAAVLPVPGRPGAPPSQGREAPERAGEDLPERGQPGREAPEVLPVRRRPR